MPHETQSVDVVSSADFPFSVLRWGSGRFGAVYDETFHRFFHQLARVATGQPTALRKWTVAPNELYVVEGTVPGEQLTELLSVLGEINEESVPAMWCGMVGPLRIAIGPNVTNSTSGRIVIRPNWDQGSSGSVGPTSIQSGTVAVNVFRPNDQRLQTRHELKGILAHELFHVAFGFHVCGGDVGQNPFGFSRTNCPYPDSLMANLGTPVTTLSPQDKLASCIVYHRDTRPGNLFPDINPTYR